MRDQIRQYLIVELLDGDSVADDAELLLSGIVDSIGVLRLVSHIEETLGIAIPPQDVIIEHFSTLQNIFEYLEGLQAS